MKSMRESRAVYMGDNISAIVEFARHSELKLPDNVKYCFHKVGDALHIFGKSSALTMSDLEQIADSVPFQSNGNSGCTVSFRTADRNIHSVIIYSEQYSDRIEQVFTAQPVQQQSNNLDYKISTTPEPEYSRCSTTVGSESRSDQGSESRSSGVSSAGWSSDFSRSNSGSESRQSSSGESRASESYSSGGSESRSNSGGESRY